MAITGENIGSVVFGLFQRVSRGLQGKEKPLATALQEVGDNIAEERQVLACYEAVLKELEPILAQYPEDLWRSRKHFPLKGSHRYQMKMIHCLVS